MMNRILAKLTSRKFWAGIAGLITPILVLVKMPENVVTTVAALITACGTLIAYIFAEGSIDAVRERSGENDADN